MAKDFILAPEPCQRGDATDGDATDEEGCCRYRHLFPEPSHQAHVLSQDWFVTHHLLHGVDHGAGAEEQHGLEEGMGHQVENAGNRGSTAHRKHHVSELGHRAVSQPFLEIHLGKSDRCTQEAGDRAHHSDHCLHNRKLGVKRVKPRHKKHSGSNHRCGMNQGGDRCRTLHGIR